jgi:hypothetical protein
VFFHFLAQNVSWHSSFAPLQQQELAFIALAGLRDSVARFFFAQLTKTGKNIPHEPEICQITIKYNKWP